MKNYFLLLFVSSLFFVLTGHSAEKAKVKEKTIAPTDTRKIDNRGALMVFSFYNLDPGQRYEVRLSRAWFGTYTYKVPKNLEFSNHRSTLSFKAPSQPDKGSQYSSVTFTVGMFLVIDLKPKIEVSVDLPSPAMMNLSIPSYKVTETFMDENPDPKKNSDTAVMDLDGLDGIDACVPDELFVCDSGRNNCPQSGDPSNRLNCYGPLQATFYCCNVSPL